MRNHSIPSVTLPGVVASALLFAASLSGGTFNASFDDGQIPLGAQVFGNADQTWTPVVETGGGSVTPCLKLTKAVNAQYGTLIIEDLDGYAPVYGFQVTFNALVGRGTAVPADGWSFCVAPDIPDASFGEAGAGTGLKIVFDTYDNTDGNPNNGIGEAPQIRVVIGGATVVASTPLLPLSDLINENFVPVEIKLNADGSLDLTYNGKVHFSKLYFPGYQPLAGSRIAIGARTGGLNAQHFIDDLSIETYLTPAPGMVQHPGDQTVLAGYPATFSIVLNNGDGATVAWLRDGVVIPGATGTTYTLSAATPADSGAKFSARVTSGTTTVTSDEATLTVVSIDLPATPVVSYNFNDGALPGDVLTYGAGLDQWGNNWWPYVSPNGGVGDSGVLQLTEAVNGQSGAVLIPDPHAGAPVYGVAARFDVRIGGGTEVPADGMSFNFGADLPDATAGEAEEGVGSGLRVCFDIYDNGAGEAPAITLKWGTTVVGEVKTALSDITTGDVFADVIVRLTPDGLLDVAWNGKVLMYRAPVPGFGSIAGGRFGFYARTGGLNANQWVDNLRIYTYLTAPLRISKQPQPVDVLVGKPAAFTVEVPDPAGVTHQWFRNGTPIGGATADAYTLPTTVAGDDGAKFTVEVKRGAETVVSDEATLSVLDLTAPTSPKISYDFNSGQPAGTDLAGTYVEGYTPVAYIEAFDGVDNSGVLKLTTSENSQAGGFRSALVENGAQLLEFTLAVDVLAGNGTPVPADGFSINVGNDLPTLAPADQENGAGTGITVAVDTYDNDDANPNNETGEAPSIDIRYKGQVVVAKRVPLALVNSGVYATVLLRLKENGLLDLAFGDTVVYRGLQVPNYVPMGGVKVALFARTGGANASYWFDNLRLGATIPALVSVAIEPNDVLLLEGHTATFTVQASNPQGVTYQWLRNGTGIPGATQPNYTTPILNAADDGTGYSVRLTGPANEVTSRTAMASVMSKFGAGASPALDLNFNDSQVPVGGTVFGTAYVQGAGGVNGTAFLQLTEAVNDQNGAFLQNTPAGVTSIADFTATWMMLVGGGTAVPADGFSFVLADDISDGSFGEDGSGSGLIVGFDTYDNGDVEVAPEITIRYRGATIATRPFDISVLRTDTVFEQIGVRVNRNGTLDLYYGETAVYRGLVLTGFVPFNAGRFGWGARTGGLNDNHWVDDVRIALNTQPAAGPTLAVGIAGGNVTVTWSGGGTLQSTTALPGGWADVQGATSGYTTPATDSTRFFRVRQ